MPPLLSVLLLSACIPSSIIKPKPAVGGKKPSDQTTSPPYISSKDSSLSEKDIDFAEAFETDSTAAPLTPEKKERFITPPVRIKSDDTTRYRNFFVPDNKVRIALMRNIVNAVVYSVGIVNLHAAQLDQTVRLRGRIAFDMKGNGRRLTVDAGKFVYNVSLPCTLYSENEYNFLEIGDATYRGSLILAAGEEAGRFTIVNYIDVEDYLRGVVPLELGKRRREEMEALKAQAVASRTYAYRLLTERLNEPFDMAATVADQVYGGVSVEYRESDMAIKATGDLVMISGDSIIKAYYHSTCGGMTADVYEAFGKPSCSYLQPVKDCDEEERAWCRISTYFTWEERWPWKQFSDIVTQSLHTVAPKNGFRGVVNSIKVDERFPCGRVKRVTITGSGWSYECGGDRIRYILRRGVRGNPILRSSNFSVISNDRNIVILNGKGYGHGVGMCQMGAVGRSQAGQDFETILKSYYKGVSIARVVVSKNKSKP